MSSAGLDINLRLGSTVTGSLAVQGTYRHFAALSGAVERGYLNGNDVEFLSGETDGSALGATARLGRRFADVAPQTAVTPYAGYTFARSSYDGWAETGGSFPAVFSDFTTLTHIARVGAEVEHDFTGDVVGTAGLALARRTTDSGTMTFDAGWIV